MTNLHLKMTPVGAVAMSVLLLNIFGLAALYSSLHRGGEFFEHPLFYKQILWLAVSWLVLIIFTFINYRLFYHIAGVLYFVTMVLLILVELFGKQVMGAQRWISVFGLTFQPSELSKIIVVFILAKFFSSQERHVFFRSVCFPLLLVIMNAFLIFKQPDLGTALIILFLFFILGLQSGIKKWYFLLLIIAGLALCPWGWNMLKEYQKKRLVVFLNPNVDPLGAGYTIIQSKIAIGSGMVFGKGFLSGTQNQFNFLPERHTDFIFTVIAEEWGFIGSIILILIYAVILLKILDVARELKDSFARLVALGVCALIFLHVFINIGMTLGILPVVGLPLLFVSYGGTHMLVTFVLLGIFFNICRQHFS